MATFSERLFELMLEKEIKSHELASIIGVSTNTVNDWKRGKFHMNLRNAIKLADFFECSIDYLVGRSEDYSYFAPTFYPLFYSHLLAVLKEYGYTTYRIRLDGILGGGHFGSWKKGCDPLIATLIPLADYLGVTLDYLVGRDR
ncbi:MAG: helix-turn-helix domain-containing protein [Firmicutes bacterium]|nr:helix-turn-helix domain-containing protein [Bacillota bacterium]